MSKVILRVILAVCILAVVVFAAALVRELLIDRQSQSFYSDLTAGIEKRPQENEPGQTGAEPPRDSGNDDSPVTRPGDEWVPYVDFGALNAKYPGTVGWLRLEGTFLDYPVMQYTDNVYFLAHLPDGTEHRSGSIFLDYRNSGDFSDKSILIYGHESRTQEMFAILKSYREQVFYEANPVIYLHTPQNDYRIVLFAGYLADSQREQPPLYFDDDESFLEYIGHLRGMSFFNSSVEVKAEDRIVSLVTCAYDFNDARLVIAGVLVEY